MPKLPDEQHFPSHLTYIDLVDCYLKEDPMPILEKLLQLKDVRLHKNSFCGRRMVCSAGGFPQLQILQLHGLEEWEEWTVEEGSMSLLHHLSIMSCPKLKQLPDVLPVIAKLPQLKYISLNKISLCGRKMICSSGGFPQLQELFLYGLEEWEEWIVEKGSMPLLHDLTFWNCPTLKELPYGLRFLTSLKTLKIYCIDLNMEKEWKEKLSEGGKEYYKVQHIPLVKIMICY